MHGRHRKLTGNEPSLFSQRIEASFNRHFPEGWPYLASTGMRKEMESSNWVRFAQTNELDVL